LDALETALRGGEAQREEVDLLAGPELPLTGDDLLALQLRARGEELRFSLIERRLQLFRIDDGEHVALPHLRSGPRPQGHDALTGAEEGGGERGHDASLHAEVALEIAAGDGGEAEAGRVDGALGARPAACGGDGEGERREQQRGRD